MSYISSEYIKYLLYKINDKRNIRKKTHVYIVLRTESVIIVSKRG